MAKIEIELVAETLQQNELDTATVDKIVRQLTRAAERAAEEAAADREPKQKTQLVFVRALHETIEFPPGTYTPKQVAEIVAEATDDMIGWVVQIPEDESPVTAVDRIHRAAFAYNATRRGQKFPVKSFGEACEVVGGKFLKEQRVSIKSRLPVMVVTTDNELPSDETKVSLEDLKS